MRKLNLSDVFACSRLIRTLGLKNELRAIMEKSKSNNKGKVNGKDEDDSVDVEQVGIDAILAIMNAAANEGADTAAYALLGPIFEMEPQKVAEMPLDDLIGNLKKLASENDLSRFFTQAANLTTSHSLT